MHFNNALGISRVVVGNAFRRLKGRFRSIGKRLDLSVDNSCTVTAACCVLHNYCEIMREDYDNQWLNEVQLKNRVCPGDHIRDRTEMHWQ